MLNVVLVTPNIPQNTGAIGRICVNTDTRLHIVKPISFDIDEKAVRRAGLDYWEKLDLQVWENVEEFLEKSGVTEANIHLATTKTTKPYFEASFSEGDFLLFGSETAGIPEEILEKFSSKNITIPMTKEGRSLNLAISCGIILYDAIRQNFKGSL